MILLETERLFIRPLALEDLSAFLAFENVNRGFGVLFSPLSSHQIHFESWLNDQEEGRSFRFVLFLKENKNEIIGTCNYSQIFRGPFQACYLGYKIAEKHEGKGMMTEAVKRTLQYMFKEQNIYRVMANYMPINARSEKLLLNVGFMKEGLAKDYLLVNGQWEDHVLTSLVNPNWKKKE